MQSNDLIRVIGLYEEFPEYEDYILYYIYNDFRCKDADYSFLLQVSHAPVQDSLLQNALKYLLIKKEYLIDSQLQGMEIEAVGKYYIAKKGDRQYLDRTFSENLAPVWPTCDYYSLKRFHSSLAGTHWQDSVDVYYLPLRDTLLSDLLLQIEAAVAYEDCLMNDMETLFLYEYDTYLQTSTEKLVQMCFDKKMPLFKSNLSSRVDEMMEQCYEEEKISGIVMSYMRDVYPALNENRQKFFKFFPSADQEEIAPFMLTVQNFVYDFPNVPYYPFEQPDLFRGKSTGFLLD